VINKIPFYNKKYQDYVKFPITNSNLRDAPLLTANELNNLDDVDDLYDDQNSSHYAFVKDGTDHIQGISYWDVIYTEKQTTKIARVLKALGISKNDRVMNLFIPGISGEFHIFNLALEKTEVTIVPLGGEAEMEVIARFIEDLDINILIGESKLLKRILEYIGEFNPHIKIDKVFSVDKNLHTEEYEYMSKHSNVYFPLHFSIETGIIGYQCPFLPTGSFHKSKDIYFEIIEENDNETGNLIISTLSRKGNPLLRYIADNNISLLNHGCPCGSNDLIYTLNH
jgi:phenylacetate-coenzyme A ligase PaaK-like adenylate-forming protein